MSEEKKAWGKACDADAPQDPKHAGPARQSGGAPAPEDDAETDSLPRARSQHVLPGILGKQLRAAYGELLNTPVPDRIADLIKQLEGKQPGKPAAAKASDEEGSQ
jgi:hypothetical protein